MRKTTAALRLMHHILTCFPPEEDLPRTPSAIRRVLNALQTWQREGSYEDLWTILDDAVNGSPDLILEFRALLPKERASAGMGTLWKARVQRLGWERDGKRDHVPDGWVGDWRSRPETE